MSENQIKFLIEKYREERRKLRIKRDATNMKLHKHTLGGEVDRLSKVISDLRRLL